MEYKKMPLSKAEINALIEIYSGKKNMAEIAASLDVGLSQVSTNVSSLEKKHLCNKIRHGKRIEIETADTTVAMAFKRLLVQNKQFKLDKFLYGLKFGILSSCLYEAKTTKEIAQMLNASRKSVQNVVHPLISRLIIKREKQALIFQKKAWPLLYEFLDAYRKFSLNGDILWKFENEMIFEVREEKEIKGTLTGFSAYGNYGVRIMNVKYCCYLPKRSLTKLEVFIHSLLQIGDDTRLLELAVVFFKKNKLTEKEVIRIAPKYDLRRKAEDVLVVLNSKEEKIITDTLPITSKGGIRDMLRLYNKV